jgi:hypothetical protein
MVILKDCKTKECENNLQELQWKEQGKEEGHAKNEKRMLKRT